MVFRTSILVSAAVLTATCLASSPIVAGESSDQDLSPYKALGFLVGYCWQGTFPDGEHVDTHCYTDMFDGAFIRDRHIVTGKRPDYLGETIFQPDSEGKKVVFRYWNSLGGVSDGYGVREGNAIHFPEDHVAEDGSTSRIRSVTKPMGDDEYLSVTEKEQDGEWVEVWTITFKKTGPAED